ncbi:universal stress protein [Streptomyces sp. NPDC059173]|uniref:universal stress protein n=1 Tax=Streptomyces sp. NPDC059173 TaxID=3346756 RepID=UPI0036B5A225
MNSEEIRQEIVVGVDHRGNWHPAVTWGADEAHLRGLRLRLALSIPPRHDTADDASNLWRLARDCRRTLETAISWTHARRPDIGITGSLLDGSPGRQLALLSHHVRLVVLGSRHLHRAEEILGSGSVVIFVTAQARCPVVVVGGPQHEGSSDPLRIVVGVDGSEPSEAALALAFEEAAIRGCALYAIAVWRPPVLSLRTGDALFRDQRRLLYETVARREKEYPDVQLHQEVRIGSPVEVLAQAGEHARGIVVGRRGEGGCTGMRVGSVVHGLLHRSHCPVITVPAR